MKRHELDWFSLVAGAVFMVIAVTQLVDAATDTSVDLGWLFPVGLVALGAAGLAGALRGGDRRARQNGGDTRPTVPVAAAPPGESPAEVAPVSQPDPSAEPRRSESPDEPRPPASS